MTAKVYVKCKKIDGKIKSKLNKKKKRKIIYVSYLPMNTNLYTKSALLSTQMYLEEMTKHLTQAH